MRVEITLYGYLLAITCFVGSVVSGWVLFLKLFYPNLPLWPHF